MKRITNIFLGIVATLTFMSCNDFLDQKINDNYPKILLTLDDIIVNPDYDGIKHINLIQWLLS